MASLALKFVLTPIGIRHQKLHSTKERNQMNMNGFIRSNVRLSRLLNALDDIAYPESYIPTIATTNISKATQTIIQPKSTRLKPLT